MSCQDPCFLEKHHGTQCGGRVSGTQGLEQCHVGLAIIHLLVCEIQDSMSGYFISMPVISLSVFVGFSTSLP